MIFTKTAMDGPVIIDVERRPDHRGFFARTFCQEEFEKAGLNPVIQQCNMAFNHQRGTLRGMHMQLAPDIETKVVRCIRGAVYDVIVDMRPGSPTRFQHFGIELSADNHRAIYIPPMFAHGFQTLTDNAEIFYQVSGNYAPKSERGLRYDDPMLGITWPLAVTRITDKDRTWPLLAERDLAEFDTP